MPQQKISPVRIFLLLSIIVGIGTILGFLLVAGKIAKIKEIYPPVANNDFCEAKILEDCDGKNVSLKGVLKYIAKGPIPILTNIENREVKYTWATGVFIVWPNGEIPNTIEGLSVAIVGKVSKGGQPCSPPGRPEQCLAPYHATRIEVKSFEVIQNAEDISITTDKTEYEQGENVKITLKNNLSKNVSYFEDAVWYQIQKFENDSWVAVERYDFCNCGARCYREPPGYFELQSGKEIFDSWNQIGGGCDKKQSAAGKYRAGARIKMDGTTEDIYSNEFTIKAKAAIDPRCSQKVNSIGNCDAYFIGYEYNSASGKCTKRGISGCEFNAPFYTLEECQKTCEKNSVSIDKCNIEIPDTLRLQSLLRYDMKNTGDGFKAFNTSGDLCGEAFSDENSYYIVQYNVPITEAMKKEVENLGAKEYGYAPQNAFILKMDADTASKVNALKFIKWTGVYQPAFRISPSISDEMIKNGSRQMLNVVIFDANYQDIISKIKGLGGEAEYKTDEYVRVAINASKIPEIARINDVVWIELYSVPSFN